MTVRKLAGLFAATALAGGISIGVAQAAQAAPATATVAVSGNGATATATVTPGTFYEIFTWFVGSSGNKCVDVPSSSTAPGTRLQVFHCKSSANQLWSFIDMGNGYFQVENKNSHLCFELPNTSGTDGTPIEQADCFGFDTQQWRFQVIFNTASTPVFGLVNQAFPSKCLTRAGGLLPADNDKLVMSECQLGTSAADPGNPHQIWALG